MIKDKKKCGLLYLIISFQNGCKNSTISNYPYCDITATFQNFPLELKYEKKISQYHSKQDLHGVLFE